MKFFSHFFYYLLMIWGFSYYGLHADVIYFKSGEVVKGKIIGIDEKSIRLVDRSGEGFSDIPYPRSLIEYIELDPLVENLELNDIAQFKEMEEAWNQRKIYLSVPRSNSGEVGLRAVELLLEKETRKAAREALKLCEIIQREDWDPERKERAKQMKLLALVLSGKTATAARAIEKMEVTGKEQQKNLSEVKIQLEFVRAELGWKRLRRLDKKWPKWHLMPEIRKERNKLVNQALDGFLNPVVFYAEQQDCKSSCARGLWKAANVYVYLQRWEEVSSVLEEILAFYEATEYGEKAKRLSKKLSKQAR